MAKRCTGEEAGRSSLFFDMLPHVVLVFGSALATAGKNELKHGQRWQKHRLPCSRKSSVGSPHHFSLIPKTPCIVWHIYIYMPTLTPQNHHPWPFLGSPAVPGPRSCLGPFHPVPKHRTRRPVPEETASTHARSFRQLVGASREARSR